MEKKEQEPEISSEQNHVQKEIPEAERCSVQPMSQERSLGFSGFNEEEKDRIEENILSSEYMYKDEEYQDMCEEYEEEIADMQYRQVNVKSGTSQQVTTRGTQTEVSMKEIQFDFIVLATICMIVFSEDVPNVCIAIPIIFSLLKYEQQLPVIKTFARKQCTNILIKIRDVLIRLQQNLQEEQ